MCTVHTHTFVLAGVFLSDMLVRMWTQKEKLWQQRGKPPVLRKVSQKLQVTVEQCISFSSTTKKISCYSEADVVLKEAEQDLMDSELHKLTNCHQSFWGTDQSQRCRCRYLLVVGKLSTRATQWVTELVHTGLVLQLTRAHLTELIDYSRLQRLQKVLKHFPALTGFKHMAAGESWNRSTTNHNPDLQAQLTLHPVSLVPLQ